jgi:hypothetical protein
MLDLPLFVLHTYLAGDKYHMPANLLFLPNKYTRWYFAIIKNAQVRTITGYVEKHHIIPKSLGGDNSLENLVVLTAREHFVCHWLLTKMVENKKYKYQLWNAFSCMLYRERPGQQRYKVNGKTFENIKKTGSVIKSWKNLGSRNPMFGKTRSEESRKKQSASTTGKIVSETTRQKLRENMLGKPKVKKICPNCERLVSPNMLKRWHGDNCKVVILGESKFLD